MNYIKGFITVLAVAVSFLFITLSLNKNHEATTPQQAQAQAQTEWKETNNYNGSHIRLWVDYKHNVVCWIYNDGMGSSSTAGLSCLPFTQVAGVPAQ